MADTLLVLSRTNQGPTLHVRGRDVEETDFAMRFNKETCKWSLVGNAETVHLSETRKKILDALLASKVGRMTPHEIAAATGLGQGRGGEPARRHGQRWTGREARSRRLRAPRAGADFTHIPPVSIVRMTENKGLQGAETNG